MNREQVLNSIALKKKFCKDCNIPISVYDNPFFYQRLCTLDPIYNGIDAFDLFCCALEEYENEQEYFTYYNSVKERAINAIKENEAYQRFSMEIFETYTPFVKKNLYVDGNDGKPFISIDMKKANFSALRFYDPAIFDFQSTWEDFIAQFTQNAHIIESKYIRQVIMGACNPGRQVKYERHLMAKLLTHIVDRCDVSVYSLGDDEIILNYIPGGNLTLDKLMEAIDSCPNDIGNLVRVQKFFLSKIPGTDGWEKIHNGFEVEFKCLSADVIHQVVKYYIGEPVTKDDLAFYHNGKLATYLEAIENPWKE